MSVEGTLVCRIHRLPSREEMSRLPPGKLARYARSVALGDCVVLDQAAVADRQRFIREALVCLADGMDRFYSATVLAYTGPLSVLVDPIGESTVEVLRTEEATA